MLQYLGTHAAATASTIAPGQIPGELALVNRFIRDVRRHRGWARAYRSTGYYTIEDLDAFFDDYAAVIARYGHDPSDVPPGARIMQLRMFYIPDEPAELPCRDETLL